MRWKKQILDNQYNPEDKTINRKYKEDLCLPLSTDPDFGLWLILCDYYGNEDTPLFNYFIKVKQLIIRNRDLEKENSNMRAFVNKINLKQALASRHPDAELMKFLNKWKWANEASKPPMVFQQQGGTPNDYSGNESGG